MIGVEVDTTDVERAIRQLGVGLDGAGRREGMEQARRTAAAIRSGVPVLTGRLRGTVDAVPVEDGGAVTYGGSLPYARKIERRTHAVAAGIAAAPAQFAAAMTDAAEAEVAKL